MPWWIWIIGGIVLVAAETIFTRDFSLFCVGVSAILVGLMTAAGILNPWAQWLGFAILSAATLVWARDWLREHFIRHVEERDLSNVLGEVAIPIDDLKAFGFGKAELRGSHWNAHNAASVAISRGQRCRVMKVRGITLWIMPE